MSVENTPELQKTLLFLQEIGIPVIEKQLPDDTFLPGLSLYQNSVFVDYDKLKYPGDLLHEAGHIAVTAAADRYKIGTAMPEGWPTQGDEIAAILWSCAATLYLGLPLEFVFHQHGYKDSADWHINNFKNGNYTGLPLLEWFGMALGKERAAQENKPEFPSMIHWMRE